MSHLYYLEAIHSLGYSVQIANNNRSVRKSSPPWLCIIVGDKEREDGSGKKDIVHLRGEGSSPEEAIQKAVTSPTVEAAQIRDKALDLQIRAALEKGSSRLVIGDAPPVPESHSGMR